MPTTTRRRSPTCRIFDAVRPAGARPAGCLRLRQPAAAGQHRRVGAGGGARHLDGARAGAEGEDHPGRGQLEQSRRPVRGRAEKAGALVAAAGGGQVSNSWGGAEFSGETAYDSYFTAKKVIYVASSGDAPGTEYPSASPNVARRHQHRPQPDHRRLRIRDHLGPGGRRAEQIRGAAFVPELDPRQLSARSAACPTSRSTPIRRPASTSIDFNAGRQRCGWWVVGGTSVAAPSVAAIINAASASASSSAAELGTISREHGERRGLCRDRQRRVRAERRLSGDEGLEFLLGRRRAARVQGEVAAAPPNLRLPMPAKAGMTTLTPAQPSVSTCSTRLAIRCWCFAPYSFMCGAAPWARSASGLAHFSITA